MVAMVFVSKTAESKSMLREGEQLRVGSLDDWVAV
jgi:hypothetical protein